MNAQAGRPAWVNEWAERIKDLQLSVLALTVLETARAFSFLGAQVILGVQPLLAGLSDDVTLQRAATLMEHPEMLDQLAALLEDREG